jgi:hypothetical protein
MKLIIIAISSIGLASACLAKPTKRQFKAAQAKMTACVKAAEISGNHTTEIKVVGDQFVQTVLVGKGVTKAQARKANACLANP